MTETTPQSKSGGNLLHHYAWSGFGKGLSQVINFVIMIYLARLLGPMVFGLVALTRLLTIISTELPRSGVMAMVVKSDSISDDHLSTYYYFGLAVAFVVTALMWLLAGPFARLMNEEQLIWPIRVASLSSVLIAASSVHRSLMLRKLHFKRLAPVDIIQTLAGGIVSITLAVNGWGLWSLIIGDVVRALSASLAAMWLQRWLPRLRFNLQLLQDQLKYVSFVMAAFVVHFVRSGLPNFLIGKLLGVASVGFYSFAFSLSDQIRSRLVPVITAVAFPTIAVLSQDEDLKQNEPLRSRVNDFIKHTTLLVLPIMAGIAILAEDIILGLLGTEWEPAVPILRILALAAIFNSYIYIIVTILRALKHARYEMAVNVLILVLLLASIPLVYHLGLAAIAYAVLASFFLATIFGFIWLYRFLGYGLTQFFSITYRIMAASLVAAGAVVLIRYVLVDVHVLLRLGVAALTGVITCNIALYAFGEVWIYRRLATLFTSRKSGAG